mgnify:CR=1 FL=1
MTKLNTRTCQRYVYIFAMTIFDIKVYIFPVKWCKISIEVGFIDLKTRALRAIIFLARRIAVAY